MFLIDVNVLIYAYRTDAEHHERYRSWLESTFESESLHGYSEQVLSAVVRILTHPGIWNTPVPLQNALQYVQAFRNHPKGYRVTPGHRHWEIFAELCRATEAKGNLVSDAYFAALAIESGAEWITTDRDYARFPGLRWRHPLA
jgi:toxin-antitoxin system PIN domain toxin